MSYDGIRKDYPFGLNLTVGDLKSWVSHWTKIPRDQVKLYTVPDSINFEKEASTLASSGVNSKTIVYVSRKDA